MILTFIIVIAAVVLIAFSINAIEDIRKNRKDYRISFKESMDLTELPVITFYNNGKKINFLIDTGSNISYINSSMIDSLTYEKIEDEMAIVGLGGTQTGNSCRMTVMYKDMEFTEEFGIVDLSEGFDTIKRESGVQIHGILGSKFFEKYKYVLDFKDLVAYIK